MRDADRALLGVGLKGSDQPGSSRHLHPNWEALIRVCEKLQFGELEKVRIQNGLPMTIEVVKTKIRLGSD